MFWPFDDPDDVNGTEEEKLNKFREVRDKIEKKVKEFVENDGNPEWEKKNFLL
jgi:arsenate reductase